MRIKNGRQNGRKTDRLVNTIQQNTTTTHGQLRRNRVYFYNLNQG